jgi:alkaline phosphatase
MTKLKNLLIFIIVILSISCANNKKEPRAKYIFLFIGDGMGIQQVNIAQLFKDSVLRDTSGISFTRFPVSSFATTYATNRYIPCSAAAGTALSTGTKTSIGTLGMNADHTDSLYSIAKTFLQSGYRVGILTSVSIDHATPAAFYAHQSSRGSYYNIAKDLLKSRYHFFAGGGFLQPNGDGKDSAQLSIYELGKRRGVAFTSTFPGIDSLRAVNAQTVVYSAPRAAPSSTLQYDVDRVSTDITLAEITQKAIEYLDGPKGFFMMVEGGKIDWACHDNDGGTAIREVIAFSDAVGKAIEFYRKHPNETLIVVTADHETGGMSLGNYTNGYKNALSILSRQRISKEQLHIAIGNMIARNERPTFNQILQLLEDKLGLSENDPKNKLTTQEVEQLKEAYSKVFAKGGSTPTTRNTYTSSDPISDRAVDILNSKAGIGWTSGSHTGSPVPVYVLGAGQGLFHGSLDNTDLPKLIVKASAMQ